jgi:hypothetical protein
MEEEKKVTVSERIGLRCGMRPRELAAPVTSNATTTSSFPRYWQPSDAELLAHKQRGEEHASQLQKFMAARKPQPMQDLQDEPSKLEAADTLAFSLMEPLRVRLPDNPERPESEAKPWKRPWDR